MTEEDIPFTVKTIKKKEMAYFKFKFPTNFKNNYKLLSRVLRLY